MFTGIVSATAKVTTADNRRVGVDHAWITKHLKIGGSVAVNGCCLTVVKRTGPVFFADVVPETLRRTNLGDLKPGSEVNLELPVSAGALLDGHIVQGHVDATARVKSVRSAASGRELTIELPTSLSRFVATKGSIAVDGVSLTLVDVEADGFSVMLIPHTLAATTLGRLRPGDRVNIEADMLAKHVRKLLAGR
jgi:riboflavin synthase